MALKDFAFKSYVDEIKKDLEKEQKKKINKAAGYVQRKLKRKATQRFGKNSNITKGVARKTLKNAALVGIGPPGFAAHLVEFGTDERFTKKGDPKGHIKANPFVLPTFEEEASEVIKILERFIA